MTKYTCSEHTTYVDFSSSLKAALIIRICIHAVVILSHAYSIRGILAAELPSLEAYSTVHSLVCTYFPVFHFACDQRYE